MNGILKLILTSVIIYPKIGSATTFGNVADNLFVGADLLTKFFWAACILVGVFLLVGCMVHYQEHRNNPKLVPLSTVITYLLLGLIAISVPFLNRLFGADAYDSVSYYQDQSSSYSS